MRLPLTAQLSTKDGVSNKNARLTNTLKEAKSTGDVASVRPGLEERTQTTGVGKGIVAFNGELISAYGANLTSGTETYITGENEIPNDAFWWNNIVYGGDRFCLTSDADKSAVSTDSGITWTYGDLPFYGYWSCLVYAFGKFYTLGRNGGSMFIANSSDGITWQSQPITLSTIYWTYAAYGNGTIVMSGSGYVLISTDGITWTQYSVSNLDSDVGLCFGGGKFCMTSFNGYSHISDNGIDWVTGSLTGVSTGNGPVGYGAGKFVIVDVVGTYSAYSIDGLTWTVNTIDHPPHYNCYQIAYNGDVFMASVQGAPTSAIALISEDGENWTEFSLTNSLPWQRVATDGRVGGPFVFSAYRDTVTFKTYVEIAGGGVVLSPIGSLSGDFFDFAQSTL